MYRLAILLTAPIALLAQNAGLTPAWDAKKTFDALVDQSKRLTPLLDEVKAEEWVAAGAPEAYLEQAKAARAEAGYIVRSTGELARAPESMTKALEVYLRLQALSSQLDSLSQGVRRYQNPALADLMQGFLSEADNARNRLQNYLVELISNKETELQVMNQEAQRCRGILIRQPDAPKPKPPGRKQNP